MTGEMGWVKPNGEDSNGDCWSVHAYVARSLRCRLRPFDTYIGPYICHKRGMLFIGSEDGSDGNVCLWPDGEAPAYREPIVETYFPIDDQDAALAAARSVLAAARA